MKKIIQPAFIFLISIIAMACGTKDASEANKEADKGPKPTLVTVTQVKNQTIEVTEEALSLIHIFQSHILFLAYWRFCLAR